MFNLSVRLLDQELWRNRRTQPPVDDFGLVDREPVVVRRMKARSLADSAVDVFDGTARSAHHMVVVVADPRLVARDRSGRLDPPEQAGVGERAQYVVYGLVGHLGQF